MVDVKDTDQSTMDTVDDVPVVGKKKDKKDVDDAFGAHALADHSDSGSGE